MSKEKIVNETVEKEIKESEIKENEIADKDNLKKDKSKKKIPWWRHVLRFVFTVAFVGVAGFGLVVLILTINEYTPEQVETVAIDGKSSESVSVGDSLKIMSWNIGYGALGEEEDYFLDGGKNVNGKSAEEVIGNLQAISEEIKEQNPDILIVQETDIDSDRSFNVDERSSIASAINGYQSSFANNYKVLYVPYPWPNIGKVDCGISTFSKLAITSSERQSLPCPFTYPWRLCNLKRCLLVSRMPIEGSDKELVIVNLHLEAYDSGEGKAAQTAQLKELLESEAEAGNYVIAGGDFNQTFSNVDLDNFPLVGEEYWKPGIIDVEAFSSELSFYMDQTNPSCRSLDKPYAGADKSNFQYYIIDGFIVSSNVQVDDFGVENLDFVNSDHNPLIMNITLK